MRRRERGGLFDRWDEVTNSTTTLESDKQYYLNNDVTVSQTITVSGTVTLDLNGHVLKYGSANNGSVIVVEGSGNLTLTDSNTTAVHKFTPDTNGLWVSDENGSKTVSGGVITGGTGYPFPLSSGRVNCGGGVYIAPGGQLTMTGGNIIGCSAEFGGGVCIYPRQNGEQISVLYVQRQHPSAASPAIAAAVFIKPGKFRTVRSGRSFAATAEGTSFNCGEAYTGVDGSFEMSGEAIIEGCQVISEYAYGGRRICQQQQKLWRCLGKAKIEGCQAISPSSPRAGRHRKAIRSSPCQAAP